MTKTIRKKVKYTRLPKGPNGGVQLLLIHSVAGLGDQGEVVEVKPGFANNFLLPQGLGTFATEHHVRMVEKHKSKLAEIDKARLVSYRNIAKELGQQSLTIEANANDEGHLYGSVAAAEISVELKRSGYAVGADQVILEGPLKELGLYTVKVRLHEKVETDVKVWVVPSVDDK